MFQAKLRGWRRLAAGLVLVPGLTGLGADALGLLGRAAGQDKPAVKAEEARELMRQARAAMDAENYGKARELAEKARALRAQGAFYDESPDDVLADLSAKGVGGKAGGKAAEKPTTTDPKALLEMAKQAYSVGELDKAQDLVMQAQAHSGNVRWGLFDDTPASVLKDIQKAKGKRDQATAERLLTDARTLVAKQAATKEERSANLMAAEEKAKQSARLHGEYSVWDFGDRPADVIADVRKAREREKIAVRPMVGSRNMDAGSRDTVASGAGTPTRTPGRTPTEDRTGTRYGETKRPSAAADAGDALTRKKAAVGLMQESMALRLGGNYIEARKKLIEADKLNAWFSKDDDTPAMLLAQLNVAAQKKVNALTAEAKSCLARKDETAARTMLDEAHALSTGMGLDTAEVAEIRLALKPTKDEASPVIRTASKGSTAEFVADLPPVTKPPESEEPPYNPVKGPAGKKPETTAPLLPPLPGELPEPPAPIKTPDTAVKMPEIRSADTPVKMPEIRTADEPVKMPEIKTADTPVKMPEIKTPGDKAPDVKLPEVPMPVIKTRKEKAEEGKPSDLILPEVKGPGAKPDIKLPADPTLVDKAPDFGKPPELPMPPVPDKGAELLKQARMEKAAGNLDGARKLVTEILSGDYSGKEEAGQLLTSIDTAEAERKMDTAKKAFQNGMDLFHAHNYAGALAVFNQIDGTLLIKADRTKLSDMIAQATAKQQAAKEGPKPATVDMPPALAPSPMSPNTPTRPTARVVEEIPGAPVPTPRVGADNLVKQKEALAQVEFQKLRSKALKIESEATARFGRGETDAALLDLQNFVAEVKGTGLDASKQNLLVRPIEARMDRLRILKHQTDFLTKETRDRRNVSSEMAQETLGKQKKQDEIASLMKAATKLQDEAKYKEAYAKLQMAQSLEPDDASVGAALKMAQVNMRREKFRKVEANKEDVTFEAINELGNYPRVNDLNPLKFSDDKERLNQMMSRKPLSGGVSRTRSDADKAIERKMSTPVSVNFKAMPLDGVIEHLQTMTNINFNLDTKGLKEGNIDPKQPISTTLNNVSLKSALNIVCQHAGLKHVIENEAIRITTAKNAVGRQETRTLSVGDLVVPAPNYGSHPGMTFHESMKAAKDAAYGVTGLGSGGGNSIRTGAGSLPGATGVGSGSNDLPGMPGKLRTSGAPLDSGYNTNKSNSGGTLERELIRLITSTIKPDSWRDLGGEGSIEYYPLGLALVINQSPEVIEEVERLLESLRKVQDLEVSIEVKVVSLGETFFERIGVDFSMGIPTHTSKGPASGEQTIPGLGGGINSTNFSGNVVGLQTPRQPTPDLDIPIRATSFGRAIPPFGGFSNSFADGGISLGLAFLSDIQVQMFLEAAQGDTRTNVMQAPKVTALNGTAATINVGDYQFFLTGITVANVAGELVFVPQNVPYIVGLAQPIPPNASIQNGLLNFTPTQPQTPGLYLAVQPVVSADRRFVRLNIQQSFTNLISGTQQIPITTIVQAQFANGGIGQPVPFTQYLQQPRFSNLEAQTVVVVPDGGTVVMGGLKYLTEGRNEFGPPVLSKIPYLNRLFKNVAYGREGRSILIMVTPRVIINREEQERQTGVSEDITTFGGF